MPQPLNLTNVTMGATLPFTAVAVDALRLVNKSHAAARSARGVAGVPTGLRSLDNAIGGLQAGLHILAAEPGAGKTALALQIAHHAASKHSLPVLYASFDEVPERLALKLLAASASLPISEMAVGKVAPDTVISAINHHAPALRSLAFVAANARLTAQELSKQWADYLTRHKREPGLLVIDSLQPWAAAIAGQGTDYRVAMGTVALALRAIANESECPVLLVSAQSRQGQGSAPMTGPPYSGDFEDGADTLLCLTNDDQVGLGIGRYGCVLTIRKNRFGQNNLPVPLVLDGRTRVFAERN
jgi:replicative DNA helicase